MIESNYLERLILDNFNKNDTLKLFKKLDRRIKFEAPDKELLNKDLGVNIHSMISDAPREEVLKAIEEINPKLSIKRLKCTKT